MTFRSAMSVLCWGVLLATIAPVRANCGRKGAAAMGPLLASITSCDSACCCDSRCHDTPGCMAWDFDFSDGEIDQDGEARRICFLRSEARLGDSVTGIAGFMEAPPGAAVLDSARTPEKDDPWADDFDDEFSVGSALNAARRRGRRTSQRSSAGSSSAAETADNKEYDSADDEWFAEEEAPASNKPWFCVAYLDQNKVEGPFPTLQKAKRRLGRRRAGPSNRKMVCEMSKSGPASDLTVASGERQSRGAGFEAFWESNEDVSVMASMCDFHSACKNNKPTVAPTPYPTAKPVARPTMYPSWSPTESPTPKPTEQPWFCVANIDKNTTKGPYWTLPGAVVALNKQRAGPKNRQMICEMDLGGPKRTTPWIVGNLSQAAGPRAGFHRYWGGKKDIKKMLKMCNSTYSCRENEPTRAPTKAPTPPRARKPWFCVASINKNNVQGPYHRLADAKQVLSQTRAGKANRQMICEMTTAGPKRGGHQVVGGFAQTRANGFEAFWYGDDDMETMVSMCAADQGCTDKPKPWFCVANMNREIVTGPYDSPEEARAELNRRQGHRYNQQMICEMSRDGVAADARWVAGRNQGSDDNFNAFWDGEEEYIIMRDMCNKDYACKNKKPAPWFCLARLSKKKVKGPYRSVQGALKALNKHKGTSANRQMICEMTEQGPNPTPQIVGGKNQAGGEAAGFQKWWFGWTDIARMNAMCKAHKKCAAGGGKDQKLFLDAPNA